MCEVNFVVSSVTMYTICGVHCGICYIKNGNLTFKERMRGCWVPLLEPRQQMGTRLVCLQQVECCSCTRSGNWTKGSWRIFFFFFIGNLLLQIYTQLYVYISAMESESGQTHLLSVSLCSQQTCVTEHRIDHSLYMSKIHK